MTIVVFLVDTSASMAQKCYLGTSLLDFAKAAVETFLKVNRCRRRLGVVHCFGRRPPGARANFKNQLCDKTGHECDLLFQQRARDPSARGDRYMLMTLEEFPKNVKVTMLNIRHKQKAMHSRWCVYRTCRCVCACARAKALQQRHNDEHGGCVQGCGTVYRVCNRANCRRVGERGRRSSTSSSRGSSRKA